MSSSSNEYYGRLLLVVRLSTDMERAKVDPEAVVEAQEIACIIAEDGFRLGQLESVDAVRVAAQAVIRYLIATGEMVQHDCGLFLPCAVNSLITAREQEGVLESSLAAQARFKLPLCSEETCSQDGLAEAFCGGSCGNAQEEDDPARIEYLEDGRVRASLLCGYCKQPLISVTQTDEEGAVSALCLEALRVEERTGSSGRSKCVKCSSAEGPQRCGHIRHSSTGNGRVAVLGIG